MTRNFLERRASKETFSTTNQIFASPCRTTLGEGKIEAHEIKNQKRNIQNISGKKN